jgi:predicted ATPase/DNA-binding CsgD family transcriptional regulator
MSVQTVAIHNLHSLSTPFIGREPEIAEIVDLLQDERCRLLTLLGAGGMGKTRLGIESIQRLTSNDFEHGVFYVPLAPLTSADNIVTTVIGILGIMIGDEGTPQQELVKFLTGRNLLLVMDNFEHVIDGADLVADILNHAPSVKILVTSRESLNLRMERIWHIQGMRYPTDAQTDDIEPYSALKLFIDRATWVRRNFSPETQLDCAIRICQLVGGMPLGIEFAASWLKSLSCADIIKHIERGIDFLETRARDIPERHRSIRAVFDHSWSLLTANEQAVFPQLSVFRGGFTLEAAEAVTNADLMTLSGLVEKSMVRRNETDRYDVHELLRQYGEEKLKAVSEVEDTLSAHTSYFEDFMREHTIDIKGRRQVDGLNDIEADIDNVVEAWYHAVDAVDYTALDQMMEGLVIYCEIRRHYKVAEVVLKHARNQLKPLNHDVVHPVYNRVCAWYIRAWSLKNPRSIPDHIYSAIADSLELAKRYKDDFTIGLCLWVSGDLLQMTYDVRKHYHKASDLFEQAIPYFHNSYYQRHGLYELAECYSRLGAVFADEQYIARSVELCQRVRRLSADSGDLIGIGRALYFLTENYKLMQHTNLEQNYLELITIWEQVGDPLATSRAKLLLGELYFFEGHISKGLRLLHDALDIISNINNTNDEMRINHQLILIALVQGDYNKGLEYCQQSERIHPIRDDFIETVLNIITGLGYSACYFGLEAYEKSIAYFVNALRQESSPSFENWYNLCRPVGALLLWHMNKLVPASELVGTILSYPDHEIGWLKQWSLFNQMCADLENQLGSNIYQSIMERSTKRELVDIIPELLNHFADESPSIEDAIVEPDSEDSRWQANQDLLTPLTHRELEVLSLIGEGLSNQEIADKLYIGKSTVRRHISNFYRKIDVTSRTQALIQARNLGLL